MKTTRITLASLLIAVGAHAAGKPNILFLFADDQRADTLAAHGNPHIKTPNLDQLVDAGFSFRGNSLFGGLSTSEGWPALVKPGLVISTPVSSPDFFPTLLEAAGVKPQPDQTLDGTSLLRLLKGSTLRERALPAATHTLCRLTDDPGERTDVSAAHPEVLQRLTAQLDKLINDGGSRPAKQP